MKKIDLLDMFKEGNLENQRIENHFDRGFPDLENVKTLLDIPEHLRIMDKDVSEDASSASFICYCVESKIPYDVICGRSGFSALDINEIVKEAKELGIYMELVKEFLVK